MFDFHKDPYKDCGEYLVVKTETNPENKNLLDLYFTNNIFYPGGAGQPADKGWLEFNNSKIEIVAARKSNDYIILSIEKNKVKYELPKIVKVKININRRKKLTIAHSSEHILFKTILNKFPNAKNLKVKLGEEISEVFFECKDFDESVISEIEADANEIIKRELEVKSELFEKNESENIKELRIKKDRIKDNKVRVVKIGDFDISACAGTHVKNTKEIPFIFIVGINRKNNEIKLKFTNSSDVLFNFATLSRDLMQTYKKENLKEFLRNTIHQQSYLKRDLRWLIKNIENLKSTHENNIIRIINLEGITNDLQNFIIKNLNKIIIISRIPGTEKTKILIKGLEGYTINSLIRSFELKGNLNKEKAVFQGVSEKANPEKIIEFLKKQNLIFIELK
ncbi:MAG: alanyl-tRNA synthetase [Candidatus Woesearchaeota archaeon]|nr:alanyl-tRNA synthetase [Candidatus Woesearchaeota archaeon]MDN5328015.1 alanyl-tRNA synthetase [Candidatus Woesearchaeota archaeon]